ncbi:hypothetical protein STAS_04893 [Striga asiatica]|uniref:Protein BIC1 n=1 Tax=Striga asiatica TaxID=4170 RepID=A0A5A7P912_STRAF|nr:hypothetical protein STAS_04893 [Striga asiatica]
MPPNIPPILPVEEKKESENINSFAERKNPESAGEKISLKPRDSVELSPESPNEPLPEVSEDSGRERLKRHRVEMAGRVWIPDMWGQEGFLKDWVDCAAFDASLVNSSILSARDSLVEEGRRANSTRLRVQNGFRTLSSSFEISPTSEKFEQKIPPQRCLYSVAVAPVALRRCFSLQPLFGLRSTSRLSPRSSTILVAAYCTDESHTQQIQADPSTVAVVFSRRLVAVARPLVW